jgi:Queuosine biosynthesis protein QueC
MCETDFSGYPDCRDDTLKSLQATLNLGMESRRGAGSGGFLSFLDVGRCLAVGIVDEHSPSSSPVQSGRKRGIVMRKDVLWRRHRHMLDGNST